MSGLLEQLRASLGGSFVVERELGGGGMSQVFSAEEIALGRRVVLKVLPPDLTHVLSAARFEREIRVAARLQHPHIVPLLTAGHAGDLLYFTMPLVEGESLRARLNRQTELPVDEALRLMREIADALAYAHREGVVHRDIKPDNILLSHRHAMVTDFGVARAVSEAVGDGTLTHTGMAIGTPVYMAPEQAAGDTGIDHRADLYALGIVAYEMLAGQPPFRASNFQALVAAHLTQSPAQLTDARPSVPPALAAVVHRCLAKRAADRYQSAEELIAALDRIAPEDATPTATPQPQILPAAGISRRNALKTAAGLGLLGVAFASGVTVAGSSRRSVAPSYQRLTFRRGMIRTARFGPDSRTVLYGALWDGDIARVYSVRPDSPESSPLSLPAAVPLAVSATGELALSLGKHDRGIMSYGTLARVPLAGGAPRELQERVKYADWSPRGDELVIVRRVDDRDQIEFAAGAVLAESEAPGGGFSFVRISPRGDAIAAFQLDAADWLNGRVVIFDRTGARRTISTGFFNVFGLAWRDDEVWFTAAEELPLFRNTLYAMSMSGRVRVVARVPGNATVHDIAGDGRVLLARTDDRSGLTVRAPGETTERDLSWLDASTAADLSPDGRQVLFSESGPGGGPRASTYLRATDGSMAVRLGDGHAQSLSPDGRWAIVRSSPDVPYLDVLPTGAGTAFRIERRGLHLLETRWLRDGQQVVVRAREDGRSARLYLIDAQGSATRALTPEALAIGESGWAVSPDGAMLAVTNGDKIEFFAVSNRGAPRGAVRSDGAHVVAWIESGLLVSDSPIAGGVVQRISLTSGRRDVWADIQPRDPAGIMNIHLRTIVVTPDGRGYAYSWHRATSDLYLVSGFA